MKLSDHREIGSHFNLRRVADVLEMGGISSTPRGRGRSMSLPMALARSFWPQSLFRQPGLLTNDFHMLWYKSDSFVAHKIASLWDVLENEWGMDIWEWCEGKTTKQVCKELRRVARVIEFCVQ